MVIYMKIIHKNDISTPIERYGTRYGDESLNYIGFKIENNEIERRVYRSTKKKNVEDMPTEFFNLWNLYFFDIKGLKICDYSYSLFNGKKSIRIELNFDTIKYEESSSLLEKILERIPYHCQNSVWDELLIFRSLFEPGKYPIRIIGIEADMDYNILNFKYYLYFYRNIEMRQFTSEQLRYLVNLDNNELYSRVWENLLKIEECFYSPIFLGVNQSEHRTERKLYFISKYYGRQISPNAAEQFRRVVISLNLESYFDQNVYQYFEYEKLFLEGIAYNLDGNFASRLYFSEIPEKLI